MKTVQPYVLEQETTDATSRILPEPGRIDVLLGDPLDARCIASRDVDPIQRLRELTTWIEEWMRTVVANAEEIDDPVYRTQVEGQLVASLLHLGEIWARFPELWPDA